jgi:hypothetical protein
MKRLWFNVAGGGILLIVIAVALIIPKAPIPDKVKQQVTSTILVPAANTAKIQPGTAKYDDKLKLLSYTTNFQGVNTIISEQPTPDSFVDIPQVYDKVVTQMGEYQSFDVDIGTVHLTRPSDLKGRQAAVLNTKGTLLFAKPSSDLTDDQWRKLFNSFAVSK